MALIPGGALEIIGLNGDMFSNTLVNDFIIRTTQSNQRLLFGSLGVSNASLILSGSNVGINKSPTLGLDINGDISVSGYSLFQSNVLVSGHIFPRSNEVYDIGSCNFRFRDLFLSGNTIDIGGVKIKRNDNATSITILDSSNTVASTTQSMVTLSNYGIGRLMTSNGYIGINNSNPTKSLDVQGDINFNGQLFQNNLPFVGSRWSSNNTGSNISYSSGRVAVGSNVFPECFSVINGNIYGSSNIYAMSRLGVGTSNPLTALDVQGDINLSGQLLLNNQLFSGSRWSFSNPGCNIYYPGGSVTVGAFPLSEKFNVNGGNMYVSHNAYIMSNVGVAKSNPMYTVDVNGDINFTGRLLQNGFQFASGGITSNDLVRRFQVAPVTFTQMISTDMSNASFVLSTGGTFQALPQNAQISLNGTKLVYIDSNTKDYDMSIAYPSLYTTEFTLTLSQPVYNGDVVDITIWPYIPNLNGIFVKNLDFASNIQFSNVGIGLPSPCNPLHAFNTGLSNWLANFQNSNVQTLISHSDGMGMKITTNSDTLNPRAVFECINGSNVVLHVRNNGVVGIGTSNVDSTYALNVQGSVNASGEVSSSSDIRLKTNIEKITDSLVKVKKLNGYNFSFKDDPEKKHIGLIAQEVQELLPEVVFKNLDGYLSVAYGNIVALLIESIKEQQEQLDHLKALINSMR